MPAWETECPPLEPELDPLLATWPDAPAPEEPIDAELPPALLPLVLPPALPDVPPEEPLPDERFDEPEPELTDAALVVFGTRLGTKAAINTMTITKTANGA